MGVTVRRAIVLGFFLYCRASVAEGLGGNEWFLAETPLNCFLSQPISPIDAKIRRRALTLGELEFVASRDPNDIEDFYVRVTTTETEVVRSTAATVRIPNTLVLNLREHRPGGSALRYVEFNSNPQGAHALAKAMRLTGTVNVDFLVSPHSNVRASLSSKGFAESYTKFLACKSSATEKQ